MAEEDGGDQRPTTTGLDQGGQSVDGRSDADAVKRPSIESDPWTTLRQFTRARIALGRAGSSLPTAELLKFSIDHAEARDAVHSELDVSRLIDDLAPLGLPIIEVSSRVATRQEYLQRPDLGRMLSPKSHAGLAERCAAVDTPFDVSITVADGLSAMAAQLHAPSLLKDLVRLLRDRGVRLAPLVVARYARVAVQDEIGSTLRSRLALILIGERPGLGTADSLGAYLTFDPRPGKTDADRNCVSSIRPAGLPPSQAANTIDYLIAQSLLREATGIELKDERSAPNLL